MNIVIAIVCFIVGYYVVSYLIKKLRKSDNSQRKGNDSSEKDEQKWEYHDWKRVNLEDRYRQVLGVTETDTPASIKEKYRDLLAKYHPDKVQHLGLEFQKIAEDKTKTIIEAYEYFQRKNNS